MKTYRYEDLKSDDIKRLCERTNILSKDVIDSVAKIEKRIIQDGDKALEELTYKFDGARQTGFKVSGNELTESKHAVSEEFKSAVKTAKRNIWKFHQQQLLSKNEEKIETSKGVFCWQKFKPIENVGLYIPGGSAPLFSTVLMLAVPAFIAGCKRIVLCTPADKSGKIAPEILWTANYLGISEIYKLGGAQAIFALAYGTNQIPKVDKIFGPGNQYVTAAKLKATAKVAIDMPAGPSEALIITDKTVNTQYTTADLLAQAEHGTNSQVVLLCDDEDKLNEIVNETKKQVKKLVRYDVAMQALKNSFALLVPDMEAALQFSNVYAPEHLLLAMDNFEKFLPLVQNAGSVFCGPYTTISFGDYASGTNHTLPTSGFARSYSGLSVRDFGKWVTFQTVTRNALQTLGKAVEIMATSEGLSAHGNAIKIRSRENNQ